MRDTIGKFEILRLLGQGAMGKVFLGRDPGLDRPVAVKTIRLGSAFGAEATARFEREARAAGSLNHPNVVTVFEFGEDEGLYYMAMEFVDGDGLDGLIRSRQCPLPELLELLAQACEGLGYAHERGIVHRDIKPSNILVSRTGKRPVAKLMDFGVALVGHSDLTQQGNWMGTVNYMAPEYLDSGKAGPASDIFAMGVILYEILSGGRRPFTGETATSVLTAILRKPPAPFLPEEVQAAPPAILEVVNRALAKLPEDRFSSADALAEAIRRCLVVPAEPVRAPAPAGQGGHQTLVVAKNGKGQCMSLRVALRQAEPGARILVMPGVYRESLVVDRPVSIIGEGGPSDVVIESAKGPCLSLQASGVRLGNLQLQGLDVDAAPALLVAQGEALVENCAIFAQSGPAVLVTGAGEPLFRDCSLRSSGQGGMLLGPRAGARLEECLVEGDGRVGLRVEAGARLTASGCRIRTTLGVGLALLPGAQATLENCQCSGQEAGGVEVEADARVELNHCRITDSRSVGVLVLERGQAALDDCDLSGHACGGVHAVAGATVQLRGCRVSGNAGLGASVLGAGLLSMEDCELQTNGEPAVLVQQGATVQMKACKVFEGQSFGVVCGAQGRGVLEGCEIYGNARTGAKVEPGGSLLLVRCDLRDGRDTGILLFEDAEVTLEECVVHRNARGGILLAKDASDPVLRGGNRIQDSLLRANGSGGAVKLAPVQ
ncbi:MAG: protein kinase [Holophaga sp.]|nr:protein kinase [Holophaga sp.]